MLYLTWKEEFKMNQMKFHDLGTIEEPLLTRAVIICNYQGKWLLSKHKGRDTWEIPGGHIEDGESWLEAAKRELHEETGATKFDIKPVCLYSVSKYGILCYATIEELEKLPDYEIEKIGFFDEVPENLTYPWHFQFFERIIEFLRS